MKLDKNSRIGIWGFGTMGKSAVCYLNAQGYKLHIMDKREASKQESDYFHEKNITWHNQNNQNEEDLFFNLSDFIIPSPGINISPTRYATHKNKWLPELDFFYHQFKKPIIAITGTIGKTSITHMLGNILQELSISVAIGGNIGIPTFDLIAEQDTVDYALLEVSSFQLMHCTQFAPTLAIFTNFYPNHLDYHASEDEYFAAKCQLLSHQKNDSLSLIPLTLREKISLNANGIRAYFSTTAMPPINMYDNERLYYIADNTIIKYAHGIHTPLIELTSTLQDLSFIDNILILASACDLMNFDIHVLHKIASSTQLPAHRIEKVCTFNNVVFYNDSKGTTTVSTLAAVEKLHQNPLHLFLGGLSKGVDRAPFVAQLKNKVKHIYCFGKEADTLLQMCFDNNISATRHINLDNALNTCMAQIKSGDCVLLSPAGSSFDLYENYEHRGNHFKELVKTYTRLL